MENFMKKKRCAARVKSFWMDIVAQKIRIGDWEGDTVIGKNHKGGLVTLAERVSRYVLAGHIASRHAAGVTAVTKRLLRSHKEKCHTITFDNGKEFAGHEIMAAYLKADIYFAHPYSSWERGLNENINGLLRQYFPKGMDLTEITDEQVQMAVDRLNHRPRIIAFGFRTPHGILRGGSSLHQATTSSCTSKLNPRSDSTSSITISENSPTPVP
jgi:IS30 family transposase